MYKDLNTENIKLKQRIEIQAQMITKMDQAITKQAQMVGELKHSVTDLKRRLVRHDNYNTPPSQKKGPRWPDTKKDEKKNGSDKSTKTRKGQKDHGDATGSPKPRGGQKGHEGRTRRPKPTEFKEHTPNACHPFAYSETLIISIAIRRASAASLTACARDLRRRRLAKTARLTLPRWALSKL